MSQSKPKKPVPRSLRSLSPHRRILPAAMKPTHFTVAEIRKIIRQVDKARRDADEG